MAVSSPDILRGLPPRLREVLLAEYNVVCKAFVECRWQQAVLSGGRFCEVVYTILDGALSGGDFAAEPSKPRRFVEACRALETRPPIQVGDHSLRILIPRVLPGIYDIRNNRNVGHVGGDVTPNHMDAALVHTTVNWILAELIRVFHDVSISEAQSIVDALVERRLPLIWQVDEVRRVLAVGLRASDRALLLLYGQTGWTDVRQLCHWAKYSNLSVFRKDVMRPLDRDLFVEYDEPRDRVIITPRGAAEVEKRLLSGDRELMIAS
jgi:hypothetical protein